MGTTLTTQVTDEALQRTQGQIINENAILSMSDKDIAWNEKKLEEATDPGNRVLDEVR